MKLKTTLNSVDLHGTEEKQLLGPVKEESGSNLLVSVIIRTKDRPETLAFALKSVENQDYRPLELVVINDGGADISPVLGSLSLADMGVRLVVNEQNLGRAKAGNAGIDKASGDYLIFLDDDDWFEPDHISALVGALRSHPESMAAYAGVKYCTSPETLEIQHVFNSGFDPVYLMLENTIPIHALLFSRMLITKGCRLDESLEVFEDWDLWLQFAQYTGFHHVDQVSAGYRSGGGSEAGWGLSPERVAQFRRQLLDKWRLKWDGERLDKAFRWSRKTWLVDLQSCRQRLDDAIQAYKMLEGTHAALNLEHKTLKQEYGKIEQALGALNGEYRHLQLAHQAVLSSTSWRMTRVWRYFGGKVKTVLLARHSGLNKLRAVSRSVRSAHEISGSWLELMAKIIRRLGKDGPSGALRRVKLLLRIQLANQREHEAYDQTLNHPFCPEDYQLAQLPQFKIGIMAHIFYVDLFEELCRYLNNIPVQYSLMVSVTSPEHIDTIENLAAKRLNGNARLIIKQVPNRGRDIAPMLVAFRSELRQLDILAHIHTKKSSYASLSSFGNRWRHHLLESLFGSEQKVRAALAQFAANDRVGIIYPETFPGLPYWAHTWLSNRCQAIPLVQRLGIADLDYNLYVDYPAGSMFWARTKALEPLLGLDLDYNDFPEEQGQTDNTLHHAIERCLVLSANAAGMQHRLQYFRDDRHLFIARSPFVLNQYCAAAVPERVFNAAELGEVISFDIFDTLLIRPFANPDAVFWMLDARVESLFGIADFTNKRKGAENYLREGLSPGKDVSITAIYQEFGQRHNLTPDICQELKKLELAAESAVLKPRSSLVGTARRLKHNGKRVILVSDMYLETRHIQAVLAANDMDFFDEIYVSSEVGLRKDQGNIWQHILSSEGISKNELLHVGDNEQSDIQVLVDNNFLSPVHVMRPISLLAELQGGREVIRLFRKQKCWQNELLLGLIANRVSDHVDRRPSEFAKAFAQPEIFGYTVIGPILLCFVSWLIKAAIADNVTALLFLSREGWLFEQLYDRILNHPLMEQEKEKLPPGSYFYCSRSFSGLAAVETPEDFKILLSGQYHGSVLQLVTGRFGIENSIELKDCLGEQVLNRQVDLPKDYDEIHGYLEQCLPLVKRQALEYKQAFGEYWRGQVGETTHPAIVDIGYSGTIQKALMRVLNRPLSGYYLVTNNASQQVLDAGGQVDACFGSLLSEEQMNTLPINKYALLLEAVLTSPQGQLKRLERTSEGSVIPKFKPGGVSQLHFDTIEKIHQGSSDFISHVIDVAGPRFYQETWDTDRIPDLLALVVHRVLDIGTLSDALSVEDTYCGNDELPVLEFYGQGLR
ncbi:MAG: HAD-IA family hydrolase [Desulfobacterium sp.]|nr:HAD-IA family hydrolase [Desulfobacterium sp.]